MSYHISRTVTGSFDDVVAKTREELSKEGFGVLTEIDVKATLKKKLDADFRPYLILGACNPPLAHRALTAEDKLGVLLPCNVVVQDKGEEGIEISAMDPAAAMSMIDSAEVGEVARIVRDKMEKVVNAV
ncbi:DUF302 domain-containing protein [Rhodobium orientis]|uniref:DUF302 domain-containing protein n=1 Tax=Rhodobium orientis TaxID=34017 RepID=A0A327JM13_9HYPH|nr:DUF302 domain-containing protein [Rhodobium orientis]MBK5951920.1 hypothetical protein [Rhodobium orientis]RAI26795.1 hypothetical protein CH339_12800 [Rhodobium orientis]